MSASKILEKLLRKGQITNLPTKQTSTATQNGISSANESKPRSDLKISSAQTERVIDPVVARLKAARKAEREQKERELREKKGLPPKSAPAARKKGSKDSGGLSLKQPGIVASRRVLNSHQGLNKGPGNRPPSSVARIDPAARPVRNEAKPKMTFSQLMAKASGIDQSKMSIGIKQKTKSPDAPSSASKRSIAGSNTSPILATKPLPSQIPTSRNNFSVDRKRSGSSPVKPASLPPVQDKAPLPVRKPSLALEAKLKKKQASKGGGGYKAVAGIRPLEQSEDDNEDDNESDMDSFIASEDEEELQEAQDYDRDEIWSIFNRGKKRSHYTAYDNYDSDDMEATGAEILEEESRSKRNALLEDKREMEKEAKLAAMKRARKMQRQR